MKMAIDDKEYDMYVRYDGKEVYETKLGKFNCIKLEPLLNEGQIFKDGEGMTLWLTDDENRIPVRVESNLRVGRITCDLKSYGGKINLSVQPRFAFKWPVVVTEDSSARVQLVPQTKTRPL